MINTGKLRVLAVASTLIFAAACNGDSTTEANPSSIDTSNGNAQSAVVGTSLAQPLTIHAFDSNGKALAGRAVTFTVGTGAGTLTTTTATTDAQGDALTNWTLGTVAGAQTVAAVVQGVGSVAFVATALASTPVAVQAESGDAQSAAAGSTLQTPLAVTVLDEFGNPVPGVKVDFTPESGALDQTEVVTDDSGVAQVVWTLGSAKGQQEVVADANGKQFTFVATAN